MGHPFDALVCIATTLLQHEHPISKCYMAHLYFLIKKYEVSGSCKVVCREPFVYAMDVTGEDCVEKTNGPEVPTCGEPTKILII